MRSADRDLGGAVGVRVGCTCEGKAWSRWPSSRSSRSWRGHNVPAAGLARACKHLESQSKARQQDKAKAVCVVSRRRRVPAARQQRTGRLRLATRKAHRQRHVRRTTQGGNGEAKVVLTIRARGGQRRRGGESMPRWVEAVQCRAGTSMQGIGASAWCRGCSSGVLLGELGSEASPSSSSGLSPRLLLLLHFSPLSSSCPPLSALSALV